MCRHRSAQPRRALFRSGLIAYREDEVEGRRVGPAELVPALAAKTVRGDTRWRRSSIARGSTTPLGRLSALEARNLPPPMAGCFIIASARIERAEVPVQKNSTVSSDRSAMTRDGTKRIRPGCNEAGDAGEVGQRAVFGRDIQRENATATAAPTACAAKKAGTSIGRMPVKVFVVMRAIVTAGLANAVEAVNQ